MEIKVKQANYVQCSVFGRTHRLLFEEIMWLCGLVSRLTGGFEFVVKTDITEQ